MGRFVIDCHGIENAADLWARYLAEVKPEAAELFGRNLDAFWDAIEGAGPGWPGENAEIVFLNSRALERIHDGAGQSYLTQFEMIARDVTLAKMTLL